MKWIYDYLFSFLYHAHTLSFFAISTVTIFLSHDSFQLMLDDYNQNIYIPDSYIRGQFLTTVHILYSSSTCKP